MAELQKVSQSDKYAARIFFYSALPLLKTIVEAEKKFGDKFKGKSFTFQVSALCPDFKSTDGKISTHFVVDNGVFTTHVGETIENPDIELIFPTLRKFNIFFSGKGMPLPKIKGAVKNITKFVPILMTLLRMAGLLQATEYPQKEEDKVMLVNLYFYLLTNAISQLNKIKHPDYLNFTTGSPDRTYALSVEGYPQLQSWLRVKDGNTKAGHGEYKRCLPFLTMKWDTPEHALGILMSKADMIDYMTKSYLSIVGAPEFGAQIGNLMMQVAYYAQGQYLDVEK